MKPILNFFKNDKIMNNMLNESKVIHCGNDETFAFFAYYNFIKNPHPMIIVMENLLACQNLYNKLNEMIKDKVFMFCVDEVTEYSTLATSPELSLQRIYILDKLINKENIIVITHTLATKRLLPSIKTFKNHCYNINVNDECNIKDLINNLIKIGYKNVFKVTQPFEFSTRGGVIDIFSINYNNPIRIEFFDTIVDSIRYFDIESQRTISTINNVRIIPATEFLVDDLYKPIEKIYEFANNQYKQTDNNLQLQSVVEDDILHISSYDFSEVIYKYYCFFDTYSTFDEYVKDFKVIIVNEDKIKDNERFIVDEYQTQVLENFMEGYCLKDLKTLITFKEFKNNLEDISYVSTDIANQVLDFSFSKVDTFDYNFEILYKQLILLLSLHYYIYIGLSSKIHYNSLKQFLLSKDLSFNEINQEDDLKQGINISNIDYNVGLDFKDYKLYVIGENEIFKNRFKPSISHFSRYRNAITISSVNELNIGDYLVHDHHGIGIYKGIETMLNNNIHRDYLKIEYKDNALLYLPLEQFKLVRKYVCKEGVVPKINKLGSSQWEKTKSKVSQRVNEIAERLVSLYSIRSQKEGVSFVKDDEFQLSFENEFGYELTKDQQNALNEIKKDMESKYIMDRLLVGDVGFGKTEVAFRAAFKAILTGKQVAMLCPTTLLARQHYLTALDRFKNFGVNIKLLSRLVPDSQIEIIKKELLAGKVNLIIGTHRLLSNDIVFKDLGLLIIDEEHKFGVEHKEKIKEIKQNVDVLTLSATPIPRTLQMALSGVRGFSTINTPIDNRMPVQTYVIRKEKHAIKEIIERELARNGQVFYLNNKIESLNSIASMISSLVKNAKIAIAHGKLNVDEMEDIMQRFVNQEFNILLCTTIIENGIDIPNVNTIIVDNADCFGLSQLYQIKGRVGRSNRLAYAYLMYNPNKQLSEIASKRLQTIKEFTALGSGYKIAMRDLITRGAGDMLGSEQSGFIESVGIDMYIEMLQKAIEKKRNEALNIEVKEEKIHLNKILNIDAYIPCNYFNNDYEKIDLYKRIDKIKNVDDLNELKEEMIDKTGKLPDCINMLFEKKEIDLFEENGVIESYDEYEKYILIKLSKDFNKYNGVGIKLFEMASKLSNTISLKYNHNQISCHISKKQDWLIILNKFVKQLALIKKEYEGK